MNIEIQFAFRSINPKLEIILTRGLLGLYLIYTEMTKIVVIFNEDKLHQSAGNKLCEIIVNFPEKNLYVYSMEDNFILAAMDAFNKLQVILSKQLQHPFKANSLINELTTIQ